MGKGAEVEIFLFFYYYCPRECTDFMGSNSRAGLTDCPGLPCLFFLFQFLAAETAPGVL